MPRGIEHRNKVTVLQAYDNYELVQWAIYAGKEQVMCYEGNNTDESLNRLTEALEAIEASGTNNVYSLRFYSETISNINTKAEFKGSTTFMFGGVPVTTQNGVTVVDRWQKEASIASHKTDPAVNEKITNLEKALEREREARHAADLKLLRLEFDHKIAGLNEKPEPDIIERVIGMVNEHPDMIEHVFTGIGNLIDRFLNGKQQQPNFQPQPAINGTTQTHIPQHFSTMNNETNSNGHSAATETETAAKNAGQANLLNDRINSALDEIENKVGTEKMTMALEAIAQMDKTKLEGFIMML
jgi:uncharacterized protein YcnI